MTRFSIVIPTHNRCDLLSVAIRSALAQRHRDFEVVVSDNASEDETPSVVGSFNDSRLRYVRTKSFLPGEPHWEFAVGQASGEYVLLLADDDCLLPQWGDRLEQVIAEYSPDVVTCGFVRCRMAQTNVRAAAQIEGRLFSCRTYRFAGQLVVASSLSYYHLISPKADPTVLDPFQFHPSAICVRRELFERIRARHGRFFVPPIGDTGYMSAFAMADDFYHIDVPLVLVGLYPISDTVHMARSASDALRGRLRTEDLQYAPLHGPYHINLAVEAHLALAEQLSGTLGLDNIYPRTGYYIEYHKQMWNQRRRNSCYGIDRREFFAAIDRLAPSEHDEIGRAVSAIEHPSSKPRTPWRKALRLCGLGGIRQRVRSLLVRPQTNGANASDGADGVTLLSCLEWLDKELTNKGDEPQETPMRVAAELIANGG